MTSQTHKPDGARNADQGLTFPRAVHPRNRSTT